MDLIEDGQQDLANLELDPQSKPLPPDPESMWKQAQSDMDVEIDTKASPRGATTSKWPNLDIAGVTLSYGAQKFIIQAMCFFGHTAAEVAPCLGFSKSASLLVSVRQVHAAWEYFHNHDGLISDKSLWERDDARFRWQVRYHIESARETQKSMRKKAEELAAEQRREQRREQTRRNFDWMSREMELEQQYYRDEFYKQSPDR